MSLIERAKKILLQPKQEWEVIAGETTSTADLYKSYIVPLAAIGPIASIIGMSVIGITMPFVGTYRIPIATAVVSSAVSYVLGLVGVYVLALIIDFLAPNFSGEKNINQALKLAAYSSTAAWVAGIFTIIPLLSILGLLGLYSLYLLYLGIPVLMKSPKEKSLVYTVVVVIAAIIIFVIISLIPRAFIRYPAPNLNMPGLTEKTEEMKEGLSKMPQGGVQMTEEQQKQMEEAAKQMEEMMKQMSQQQEEKGQ